MYWPENVPKSKSNQRAKIYGQNSKKENFNFDNFHISKNELVIAIVPPLSALNPLKTFSRSGLLTAPPDPSLSSWTKYFKLGNQIQAGNYDVRCDMENLNVSCS